MNAKYSRMPTCTYLLKIRLPATGATGSVLRDPVLPPQLCPGIDGYGAGLSDGPEISRGDAVQECGPLVPRESQNGLGDILRVADHDGFSGNGHLDACATFTEAAPDPFCGGVRLRVQIQLVRLSSALPGDPGRAKDEVMWRRHS